MSHITAVAVQITDLDALADAAQALGGQLHRGETRYAWYGRFMYDTPLPAGVKVEELGHCAHAISFPNAAYQVGVVAQPDAKGYALRFDYYRPGGLLPIIGENAARLVQEYAAAKVQREAKRKGLRVTRKAGQDGRILLELAR